MILETVTIPSTGSFTLLGRANSEFTVKIVFVDRCRLEFALTRDCLIAPHSTFKFLNSTGTVQQLSWESQSVRTLGLARYVDTALWFVAQLVGS